MPPHDRTQALLDAVTGRLDRPAVLESVRPSWTGKTHGNTGDVSPMQTPSPSRSLVCFQHADSTPPSQLSRAQDLSQSVSPKHRVPEAQVRKQPAGSYNGVEADQRHDSLSYPQFHLPFNPTSPLPLPQQLERPPNPTTDEDGQSKNGTLLRHESSSTTETHVSDNERRCERYVRGNVEVEITYWHKAAVCPDNPLGEVTYGEAVSRQLSQATVDSVKASLAHIPPSYNIRDENEFMRHPPVDPQMRRSNFSSYGIHHPSLQSHGWGSTSTQPRSYKFSRGISWSEEDRSRPESPSMHNPRNSIGGYDDPLRPIHHIGKQRHESRISGWLKKVLDRFGEEEDEEENIGHRVRGANQLQRQPRRASVADRFREVWDEVRRESLVDRFRDFMVPQPMLVQAGCDECEQEQRRLLRWRREGAARRRVEVKRCRIEAENLNLRPTRFVTGLWFAANLTMLGAVVTGIARSLVMGNLFLLTSSVPVLGAWLILVQQTFGVWGRWYSRCLGRRLPEDDLEREPRRAGVSDRVGYGSFE